MPFFTSCRVALCLVGFFGAIVFFVIRSSFSMAVVCMTTPKYAVLSVEQVADVVNASGALLRDECGAPGWRRGADVVFETFSRRRCGVLQLPHQVRPRRLVFTVEEASTKNVEQKHSADMCTKFRFSRVR